MHTAVLTTAQHALLYALAVHQPPSAWYSLLGTLCLVLYLLLSTWYYSLPIACTTHHGCTMLAKSSGCSLATNVQSAFNATSRLMPLGWCLISPILAIAQSQCKPQATHALLMNRTTHALLTNTHNLDSQRLQAIRESYRKQLHSIQVPPTSGFIIW